MGEKSPERRVPDREGKPQKDRRAEHERAIGRTAVNGAKNDKNKK